MKKKISQKIEIMSTNIIFLKIITYAILVDIIIWYTTLAEHGHQISQVFENLIILSKDIIRRSIPKLCCTPAPKISMIHEVLSKAYKL